MKSLLFLTRMARMKKSFSLVLFSLLVLASCEGSSSSSLSSSEAKKYVVSTAHDYYSYAVTTSFQFLREEGEVAPSDVYDEITSDFALGSRYMDTNLSYGGIQVNAKTLSEEEGTFEIDKAFYDILSFALEAEEMTDGYIDILSGNLNWLWKDSFPKDGETFSRPTEEEISSSILQMQESSLTLEEENGKYYATKEGSALLDFGAIGKGYALMCLKEICEDNQLTYYLINAGSSSILVGENPYAEDHTFTVGVSDVEGMKFKVKNEAIGTSSVTNQHYFDASTNTLYSHVVNPKTGNAVPALTTAIVLGENAAICDVLSTYFLMLGESADVSTFEEMGYSFFFYDNRRSDPSVYLSEDFPITEE